MKQNKIIFIFFLAGVGALSFFAVKALADISNVQYPVSQLGNCKSETDCRSYCDKPGNTAACLDFAEQNDLMSKEEIEMAKKFVAAGNKGPGGCTGKDSCETYCNNISNIEECISFAEENDLIPPDELQEAKKVRDAIRRGVKPPACGSKKSCDSYCEDPSHMEECITFASEAGLMDDQEKGDAQKMLQALKRGVKPPPCRGKQACDEYCQQPDNMEVCMNFALEAGFMPEAERENVQKMLSAIKKGIKPPNCRGKDECDSYCQSDEHFEECTEFAAAAGFMSEKDAEMARKTKGKGPGGCKGKEECESFCNNKDNQETCFKFAEENGMIPEEDLKNMKEGMGKMREGFNNAPEAVKDCLKSALGEKTLNQIQSGELMPGPQVGDQMKNCFDKMPRPSGEMREGGGEREFRQGPGGCSTPEECQSYCSQNPEACQNSQEPGNEQRQMGPPGEFERQPPPSGLDQNQFQPPREGEERRELEGQMPPDEQFQPSEPMPQIQQQPQGEIAPPPPPPPSESAPQSLLNNKYLGAIFRFLFSN